MATSDSTLNYWANQTLTPEQLAQISGSGNTAFGGMNWRSYQPYTTDISGDNQWDTDPTHMQYIGWNSNQNNNMTGGYSENLYDSLGKLTSQQTVDKPNTFDKLIDYGAMGVMGAAGATALGGAIGGAAGTAGYAGDATAAGYDPLFGTGATSSGVDVGTNLASGVGGFGDGAGGMALQEGAYPASLTAGVPAATSTAAGSSLFSNPLASKALSLGASTLLGGGGSGSGSGGGALTGIAGLLSGIYGANQQAKAGSGLLDYLKQRQALNDNMYSAGSPELQALQQEMDRKDAAAGRNSQYGPRAVDLAARIAQLKMNANTQMTTGISKYINDGLQQKANSGSQITSMLPGLLNSGAGTSLLQLIQKLTQGGATSDGWGPTWNDANAPGGSNFGGDIGYDDPFGP